MLQCHSHYSFLEGVSSPEALVERAVELGCPFVALTDRDGLFGASFFYRACREAGIHPVIGAQVGGVILLCENMAGYSNLSQMITKGVVAPAEGLFCVADERLEELKEVWGERLFVGLSHGQGEGDLARCWKLVEEAERLGLECVIAGGVRYARREEGKIFDVLTCIRHHTTLRESEVVRAGNWERYLRDPGELYGEFGEAIEATEALARRCQVDLDFSSYRFPHFPVPEGEATASHLRALCEERAGVLCADLEKELALIEKLDMSGYFLIVWDLVEFAKKRGIPAQGRGSAANSLVAFVLGITPVDPREHDLFLGRFINEEMRAIPDIDIDFAATRGADEPDREDVIQYVYEKYGAEHVAMVCTFITFRHKLAAREVGKVLELDKELIARVAKHGFSGEEPAIYEELVSGLKGIPRHMSIHVGGMLIASRPISELVPLQPARMEGRVVCQWDKDMVEDAGLIKVDVLSLGMLAVLRDVGVEEVPDDDPEVYAMLCRADTVGLFQVESRAQMQSLPKTQPRDLPQLGIQVAIIRPGPLQGKMVNPYIRRRQGREPVTYAHPCLEPVLGETLGVILFQEQVLKVAVAMAGFSSAEAEDLRRTMSRKRSHAGMEELRQRFLQGASERGVSGEIAEMTFDQLLGFASYGFCKSHALSFAHIAYRSAYLKHHYPAPYLAAMLNNQPMGFYSTEVLINDGKRHGVEVLSVDVNLSGAHTVAMGKAIRLGLMHVHGIGEERAKGIIEARGVEPFKDVRDFAQRTGLDDRRIEALIQADAFGNDRRENYWKLWSKEHVVPLFEEAAVPGLPKQSEWEELLDEYRSLGFSPKGHPMSFLRTDELRSDKLGGVADESVVTVAGLQVCRQRPPTAKGFAFLTLEDEAGLMNIIVTPQLWERDRVLIKEAALLRVRGLKQGVNIKAHAIARLR